MRLIYCAVLLPPLLLALLCANLVQMLSLTLLPFSPSAFRSVNRFLARQWFDALTRFLLHLPGLTIRITGDELPAENAFVVANHQTMADIPAVVTVATRAGRSGDLKWFVKDPLKWVPGVGWGLLFLECLFVKRNWNADKDMILATFARLRASRTPFWILSFVEGTRLTPAKLQRSQDFCRTAGLPVLQEVMSPRSRGFEATLEGLEGMVDAVYDMTIAFEGFPVGRVPGLAGLMLGPIRSMHVHAVRYPFRELPGDRDGRVQWLLDRFAEKDRRMTEFRRTGSLSAL